MYITIYIMYTNIDVRYSGWKPMQDRLSVIAQTCQSHK